MPQFSTSHFVGYVVRFGLLGQAVSHPQGAGKAKEEKPMSPDEKHHSTTITVNSVDHQVPHGKISYSQVVELAFPGGSSSGAIYLVKYSRGASDHETGTLAQGESVTVKDGMRFRVSPTGES